jgi:hypothetical protein
VITQSNVTPSRRFDAANRSSSQFERHSQPTVRRGEQIVVAIRDHRQAETLGEPGERIGRVGEGGPLPHRAAEGRGLLERRLDAELRADAAHAAGKDVPVPPVGPGLDRGLVARVPLEEVLVLGDDVARVEDPPQARQDAGLPVDERAVAVEREHLEALEGDGHAAGTSCGGHPRRAYHRARGGNQGARRTVSGA